MAIRRIPMSLNLEVRQNLWASVPYIDEQTGVKHGNPADSQVEKSGHPPTILGVRMPGCPHILNTAVCAQCKLTLVLYLGSMLRYGVGNKI